MALQQIVETTRIETEPSLGYGFEAFLSSDQFVSRPINKPYGQHENKLIQPTGPTTVYTNFKPNSIELGIGVNQPGQHHREKVMWQQDLPYK